MGKNASVSPGLHFESFVDNHIADGRYKNASEVIRAGLRLLEEDENRVVALRNAIQEGIERDCGRFQSSKTSPKFKIGKKGKWLSIT